VILGYSRYLSTRLARIARQLPRFPHALSLVWTAARGWTLAWAAILVAQGLLPVATVYLSRPLVNAVLAAMRPGGNFRPALIYAGVMAGVMLAIEVLGSLSSWVRTAQAELVRNHIKQLVQEKSAAVDLGFYETPEFFDHLHRARAEASTVPLALIENLGGLGKNAITLLAMAGVLAAICAAWQHSACFLCRPAVCRPAACMVGAHYTGPAPFRLL
jgi:ATP-binding cassette, subfamily B, bacterial